MVGVHTEVGQDTSEGVLVKSTEEFERVKCESLGGREM